MQIPILQSIVIVFCLSIFVLLVFQKFKIPSLIGYLLTGIIAGPYLLGLVEETSHEIEVLAEIGVIFLLFAIGIEFSLKSLIKIGRTVFLGGSLQVVITILFVFLINYFWGLSQTESLVIGFVVSLSSTAIILKVLQERNEINTIQGKSTIGILIFQDIAVVPMMLIIPILTGQSENLVVDIFLLGAKAIGLILLTLILARYIVPKLLHIVALSKNKELFIVSLLVFGFGLPWLTSELGLSLSLGAFLAGLAISESDYSHHAFGNIIPLRDIFTSFFFISIGMLFNINFLLEHPVSILGIAILVLAIKTLIAGFVAFILGFPLRTTILIGLILCQIGEFSFILSGIGFKSGILTENSYNYLLSITIITMILAPFIIWLAPKFSDFVLKLPFSEKLRAGLKPVPKSDKVTIQNHLIIAGYGFSGSNITKAAQIVGIPYVVIDCDAETIKEKRKENQPFIFGDAKHESVLLHANIKEANVLVIAVGDIIDQYTITTLARSLNPKIHIILRTKHIEDVEVLYQEGANEVIPEEFETSLEIFYRVLTKYLIPKSDIENLVSEFRSDSYEIFRKNKYRPTEIYDLKVYVPDFEISSVRVTKESRVIGKNLREIQLRQNYGVSIAAIKKGINTITRLEPEMVINEGDIVYLIGESILLSYAAALFTQTNPKCPIDLDTVKKKKLNLENIKGIEPKFLS